MLVYGRFYLLKASLTYVLIGLVFLAPFAIIEATNGYRFFHVLTADIFGTETLDNLGYSYFRHGIHRASTIFSHPILYSIIAIMLFPLLYIYRSPLHKTLFFFGIITAMVTSVTSAGILMFASQIGLAMCKKLERIIPLIFKYLVIIVISFYVIVSFASNRGPVLVLIQSLSLNSQTAYTRYQQWIFSFDDIANNPIFGIGFNEWSRPFWMQISIDSFWLMTILQNGSFALLALSTCFIYSMKSYWLYWRLSKDTLFFCFFVSIFSIVFAGFTVDFFDRAQLMVFFFLGVFNSFIVANSDINSSRDQA
jgi:O-antigen ligase